MDINETIPPNKFFKGLFWGVMLSGPMWAAIFTLALMILVFTMHPDPPLYPLDNGIPLHGSAPEEKQINPPAD